MDLWQSVKANKVIAAEWLEHVQDEDEDSEVFDTVL